MPEEIKAEVRSTIDLYKVAQDVLEAKAMANKTQEALNGVVERSAEEIRKYVREGLEALENAKEEIYEATSKAFDAKCAAREVQQKLDELGQTAEQIVLRCIEVQVERHLKVSIAKSVRRCCYEVLQESELDRKVAALNELHERHLDDYRALGLLVNNHLYSHTKKPRKKRRRATALTKKRKQKGAKRAR